MYSPATRVLTLLELLQAHGTLSGREIAQRLEVDVRSVRRYVMMLRDLGIPVESEKGRYGAYSLRPGFRLPPLMFNEPEILAIILGLLVARRLGLAQAVGVESAAAKIERVLPDELRERSRALQGVLTLNLSGYASTSTDTLAIFSLAAYQHHALEMTYAAPQRPPTGRVIDPYGLVYHSGYWYTVAYCHLREDLRIFRLDRVTAASLTEASFEPPADFDALEYLLHEIAMLPGVWTLDVRIYAPIEVVRSHIPGDMAALEVLPDCVRMHGYSENLDWLARFLVRSALPIRIIEPPELREAFRNLASQLLQMAGESVP